MNEVAKYADMAMYRSEDMPFDVNKDGPQVTILNASPEPLAAIASTCKIYKGEVVRDFSDIDADERMQYWEQVQKTHLQMPLETVSFQFMIEGVTRSFTHQIVRQRTAAYAQESLRFAVKEDFRNEVAMPPSVAELKHDDPRRVRWDIAVQHANDDYNALVNAGVPAEDARGLLPHAITTRLHYITNLRGLNEHAGNRLCTQAQFEWRQVWMKIIEALSNYCSDPTCEVEGEQHLDCDNWEFKEIAQIFRPICYKTGKCEFKADFDRACSIRDRVEANHAVGRTSDKWHLPLFNKEDLIADGQVIGEVKTGEGIDPIFPEEWMLDHNSARQR